MRNTLDKISNRREEEKVKASKLEVYLNRVSIGLSALAGAHFTLNIAQTSILMDMDKRVLGALSVISSVSALAIGCVSKHALTTRRELQRCVENQRRWDKAEDAFLIELSNSLEDGKLTSREHERLQDIYSSVDDCVDGSKNLLAKKNSLL